MALSLRGLVEAVADKEVRCRDAQNRSAHLLSNKSTLVRLSFLVRSFFVGCSQNSLTTSK